MALIMIAEDDEHLTRILKDFLRSRGHQVFSVADGVNASIRAQEWKPQLIIMDIMMPGAYGTSAFRSMEAAGVTRTTPVIFLTALPREKAAQIVPATATTRLLLKPLSLQDLAAVMAELLPESDPASGAGER
ncbi:MAG: hypothetical protein A2X36_17165 [Elusimicrobia bacterium GWA2_69_24]|nr:MAG: hypothetical protein A2X36_17165 [Elusimicrobia bacterium GWA2_69_24]HBL16849.1 hypothetical protein [Elusimicrobiota bacterium]